MDGIIQRSGRELQRLQASREELVERIALAIREDGESQPLKGVHLARLSTPTEKIHSVLEPSLCVIAQGSKVVFVGDSRYQYDPFKETAREFPSPLGDRDESADGPEAIIFLDTRYYSAGWFQPKPRQPCPQSRLGSRDGLCRRPA